MDLGEVAKTGRVGFLLHIAVYTSLSIVRAFGRLMFGLLICWSLLVIRISGQLKTTGDFTF